MGALLVASRVAHRLVVSGTRNSSAAGALPGAEQLAALLSTVVRVDCDVFQWALLHIYTRVAWLEMS
jgi:hypothetical protein